MFFSLVETLDEFNRLVLSRTGTKATLSDTRIRAIMHVKFVPMVSKSLRQMNLTKHVYTHTHKPMTRVRIEYHYLSAASMR